MNSLRRNILDLRIIADAYRTRADADVATGAASATVAYNLSQAAAFTKAADSLDVALALAADRAEQEVAA